MAKGFYPAFARRRRVFFWAVVLAVLLTPLTAFAGVCSISIETDPPEAHVYLNGRYLGKSPFWLQFGFPFTVDVKILKPGYKKWQKKIFIPLDQFLEVEVRMEPGDDGSTDGIDFDALAPKLILNTDPPGAEVLINGRSAGTTPLERKGSELPRDITIEIYKKGYRKWVGNARVPLDIEFPIKINLIPEKK
jgi:hypothetical protein